MRPVHIYQVMRIYKQVLNVLDLSLVVRWRGGENTDVFYEVEEDRLGDLEERVGVVGRYLGGRGGRWVELRDAFRWEGGEGVGDL
jgi:hypothetical protein